MATDLNQLIKSIATSSPDQVAALLEAMGQKERPMLPFSSPVDPVSAANAEFAISQVADAKSADDIRSLLNSLGQTGAYSVPATTPAVPPAQVASPQDRVTYLQQNDPSFQQAAPVKKDETKIDKGAFPAAFDQPYTGKVRTEGGAARVNAFTEQHGVRAIVDKNGRVTLTNLDPTTGEPTPQSQKQVFGFSPLGGNVSNSVSTLIENLRRTQDPDAARGIASTLRTSIAAQTASVEAQAMKFAENKVGLPGLEATLAAAEQLDRSQPGYMPGMGDSKNTSAIRQQIYSARNAANAVAKQWLEGNVGYAQLKASASTAEAEMKRIDLLATRKAQVQTTAQIRREEEIAEEQRKASVEYEALSEPQRQLIIRLNPILRDKADNKAEVVAFYKRQIRDDKNFKEIIQAEPSSFVSLAVKGNPYALNLVAEEEATRTQKDSNAIKAEIIGIRSIVNEPDFVKKFVELQIAGVPGNEEELRKQATATFTAAALDKSVEGKAKLREQQLNAAIQIYKMGKTQKFIDNVGSWGVEDPALQAAIQTAQQTSGSTSVDNVMAAYVGDRSGDEALAAYSSFRSLMERAAAKTTNSIFGKIDTSLANKTIVNAANSSGSIAELIRKMSSRIAQSVAEQAKFTIQLAPFLGPKPPQVNIDPATGKPFGSQ